MYRVFRLNESVQSTISHLLDTTDLYDMTAITLWLPSIFTHLFEHRRL